GAAAVEAELDRHLERAGVLDAGRHVPAALDLAAQRIHLALRQLRAAGRALAAERGLLGGAFGAAAGGLLAVEERGHLVEAEILLVGFLLRCLLLHRPVVVLALRRL